MLRGSSSPETLRIWKEVRGVLHCIWGGNHGPPAHVRPESFRRLRQARLQLYRSNRLRRRTVRLAPVLPACPFFLSEWTGPSAPPPPSCFPRLCRSFPFLLFPSLPPRHPY